jgi:flavodoxin
MKSLVVYYSKTGRTRQFAWEIDKYLKENNLDSKMISIYDIRPEDILQADIILLGCWTSGLFFILQHPDKTWKECTAGFPDMSGKKVGFFTTYLTATGSMFRNMHKNLKGKLTGPVTLRLKSRNAKLSDNNKDQIKEFIATEGNKP